MAIEQRAPKDDSSFRPVGADDRVWRPFTVVGARATRHEVDVDPAHDRYAAIDDLDDGFASLDVSTWPRLDGEGRLFWDAEDDPLDVVLPVAPLQAWIDRRRRRHRTTAADRPLRIGDTFLLRPVAAGRVRRDLLEIGPGLPAVWDAWDITKAARAAAKMALFGAAASTVSRDRAAELRLDAPYEPAGDDRDAIDVRQQPRGGDALPSRPPTRPPGVVP